jgi:ABC-type multidrug transport system fused ATPase/permease subunit
LKQSKILLIDEATVNVDRTTNLLIQNRTILTITHRLNTVAKSNRIIVLYQEMMVDFDIPNNILPKHGLIQQMNYDQLIKLD